MKIAVTAQVPDKHSPVDTRFGRAGCFIIHDTRMDAWDALENVQNINAVQGAGIQAAAHVVNSGCTVLITGHCGPKAFAVLEKAGVEVYQTEALPVSEAIKRYGDGTLERMQNANVEGHW